MTDQPQNTAETSELRELVASWRKDSAEAIRRGRKSDDDFFDGVQNTYDQCADELEAALQSHSAEVAAQKRLIDAIAQAVHQWPEGSRNAYRPDQLPSLVQSLSALKARVQELEAALAATQNSPKGRE